MEPLHEDVLTLIEESPLFEELLQIPEVGSSIRHLLAHAHCWTLVPGASWELPERERRGAYAVLRGRGALAQGGDESSAVIESGQIFGQWSGLRRQPLPDRVTAVEEAVILECNGELLKTALGPRASGRDQRFKTAFYLPLVLASPLFRETPGEKLKDAVEKSRFVSCPATAPIIDAGELGSTMFFLLRGRAHVELWKPERDLRQALQDAPHPDLAAGEFFGELGVLFGEARTATVVAVEDCLLMECGLVVFNKLRKLIPRLKEQVDACYAERAFFAHMARSELFRDVEPEALALVQRRATLETYEPYEPIFFQGEPADALYVIQNGTVNVTQEIEGGPVALTQLRSGDVFGEVALLNRPDPAVPAARAVGPVTAAASGGHTATVTALQHADIARLPIDAFDEMTAAFPAVAEHLRCLLRDRREQDRLLYRDTTARAAHRWIMDRQLTPGNHVLAIDMASCILCGNCVAACEQTHEDGLSRFFWDELRSNEDLLPQVRISPSCQHCEYALCASACPTEAIERERTSGAVFIDYEKCIQCGKCADPKQGCPYGSIHIVPASQVRGATHNGGSRSTRPRILERLKPLFGAGRAAPAVAPAPAKGPKKADNYPVKCDLCYGQPYEACVHHCPTGAVFRFDGYTHMEERLRGLEASGAEPTLERWRLHFNAEFTPPQAPRPAVLRLTLSDQGDGVALPFVRPERGVQTVVANLYLSAPSSFNLGGGPLRQLLLPAAGGTATAEYQISVRASGAQTLRVSIYQGGFYLTTLPVDATIPGAG